MYVSFLACMGLRMESVSGVSPVRIHTGPIRRPFSLRSSSEAASVSIEAVFFALKKGLGATELYSARHISWI